MNKNLSKNMLKKILLLSSIIGSIQLGSCQLINQDNDVQFSENQKKTELLKRYQGSLPVVTSVPIPEKLYFAGEKIPVERTDVREKLDLELVSNSYRHSRTLLVLKKMGRWEKQIKGILKENGIPEDFFYLAVAESELDNTIKSPVGASGMWQFMKSTAKEYDLIVDHSVDQRRDPILATKAACKYLKDSYKKFNNWGLVMASYNSGMGGTNKKIKDQKVSSYFDLNLNKETARYVYRILAFKLILEFPEKYGFFVPQNERYKPYKYTEIEINSNIHDLVTFAKKHNTTYDMLRLYNPWLNNRSSYQLHVHHHTYKMLIPKK